MSDHILGGDTCREYCGRQLRECGLPATSGLCPAHRAERDQSTKEGR